MNSLDRLNEVSHLVGIDIFELFYNQPNISDKDHLAFERASFLNKYCFDLYELGEKDFSWQKLHDTGKLCLRAYEIFEEEMKKEGVDPTKGRYKVKIVEGKYQHDDSRTEKRICRPTTRSSRE